MTSRKRGKDWRRLDPHYPQELEKYGRAVPSRDYILTVLSERGVPLTWQALCNELKIDDEWEVDAVRRRLRAMEREGQLIRNRREGYGLPEKMDLVRGRVLGHPEGYGFLVPDDGSPDLYLSPREMRALLHADRIVACVTGVDARGRREGSLVEVLERNTQRMVGRYFRERSIGFVEPNNRRISQKVLIPNEESHGAQHGQIVVIELLEQPSSQQPAIGRVREVLGEHMAPGMEVEIAIVDHDIPHLWPEAALAQAEAYGDSIPEAAKAGRVDLREMPLVTIDGITARDFDDAVYCERRGANFRLYVAIADVGYYVPPGSPLDIEAQKRGNSVYFPDRVIPMLPEALSNGLCSLNPQVERLCMVCEMTISPEGRIIRSRFFEGLMRSAARLTYDVVASILVEQQPHLRTQFAHLVPHLENLHALYRVLHRAREQRGAIDFETQETVIEYGPERKIERILPTERNDAHKLIEECMIAANVAAARFLQRHRMPTLYRVHEGPSNERLDKLRRFLGELGLGLGGGEQPSPKDYAMTLERARERPDLALIQTVMLRSLSQAVYSPDNQGHFGLALDSYVHYTSPIRRYPDLLVHRAIRHVLQGGKPKDFCYSLEAMQTLGQQCSSTERRADEATREAVEWLKCEFMLDKVGLTYAGTVNAATAFGLFVGLREVFVEGLVHITALPNDYYHFDPVGQRLQGERSGRVYRLGDSINVRVVRVNPDERKIDFEVVEAKRGDNGRAGGKRRTGGRHGRN